MTISIDNLIAAAATNGIDLDTLIARMKEVKKQGGINHLDNYVETHQRELEMLSEGIRGVFASLVNYNDEHGTDLQLDASLLLKVDGAANCIVDGRKSKKVKRAYTAVAVDMAQLHSLLAAQVDSKGGIKLSIYPHTTEAKKAVAVSAVLLEGGKVKIGSKTHDSLQLAAQAVLHDAHAKGTRAIKGGNPMKLTRINYEGSELTIESLWKLLHA